MTLNILSELNQILTQAKLKSSKSIYEWSVGDLGSKIEKNITDKVSLKSIKKEDILVIAQTAISSLASQQDSDGDVQLTVDSIDGTKLTGIAKNGDSIDLDILEMRILEAYSMMDSQIKIYVVDLPSKTKNKEFKENKESVLESSKEDTNTVLSKSDMNTTFNKFIKQLETYSENLLDEASEQPEDLNDTEYFKDSKLVKTVESYLNTVLSYLEDMNEAPLSKLDQRGWKVFVNRTKNLIKDFNKDYFYAVTSVDGIRFDLESWQKKFNSALS